ncbi:MAG TPA: hypothetical protein VKI19_04685 [Acidimicrobiales bacterium]|nr:hypothetical protein [Acidimicrobiales bacterium]
MRYARLPALAVVLGSVLIGACSGHAGAHHPSASAATTPAERTASTRVAPLGAFCGRVTDLTTATAEVGVVTQLDQVRARLADAARLADQAATDGTPQGSGTFADLLALDHDLQSVNNWVDTTATQADLDHNLQPPDVQPRFTDLGVRFRALQAWTRDHCQAFGGGKD